MQIFDSLIVGAGIAGLSAAWDLAQIQGETNILVLEQNSHVEIGRASCRERVS